MHGRAKEIIDEMHPYYILLSINQPTFYQPTFYQLSECNAAYIYIVPMALDND